MWTHFHVGEGERITLFDAGRCERCDSPVIEVNSVTGCDPIQRYLDLGLIEVFGPLAGEILVDDSGEYSCERCEKE